MGVGGADKDVHRAGKDVFGADNDAPDQRILVATADKDVPAAGRDVSGRCILASGKNKPLLGGCNRGFSLWIFACTPCR